MTDDRLSQEWNLVTLPPEGHSDLPLYVWNLWQVASDEKERLNLPERWKHNYMLYRGNHWQNNLARYTKAGRDRLPINLFFANVQRTVANITARQPVAEVVDLDGGLQDLAQLATARTRKWWKETGQQKKLKMSATKMEKYGITTEKPVWRPNKVWKTPADGSGTSFLADLGYPDITIVDPFATFPCPGYYEDPARQLPYWVQIQIMPVEEAERIYGVDGILPDDAYTVLGMDREESKPIVSGTRPGSINATSNYASRIEHPRLRGPEIRQGYAIIYEMWIRDYSTQTVNRVVGQDDEGNEVAEKVEVRKYPDGVRQITFSRGDGDGAQNGVMVLRDRPNPNLNWEGHPIEVLRRTYAWGRFPLYIQNSYESSIDNWGFSAAEQVGDLLIKIDEIFSRIVGYVKRALFPPLIIPGNIGITRSMINSKPNLILMPSNALFSQYIRFVPVPGITADTFKVLELLLSFFDRIYSIEDADRGILPKGVVAAQAIVALQERNAVLIQSKITATDYLVEERGKWAMSMWQNFGGIAESVDVNEEPMTFVGTDLAGHRFNYVVESGSMVPKTSLQVQAQAEKYYELGIIDRQAVLETSNFPNWKRIIERVGEGQLGQALQLLIQAGLPDMPPGDGSAWDILNAQTLHQVLAQNQGGPGNIRQKSASSAAQGATRSPAAA